MFTGLVKEVGEIISSSSTSSGKRFRISAPVLGPMIGIDDSVAVNGVCLTAISRDKNIFEIDAVHVTLEKTTTGLLKNQDKVNLELALSLGDRLGGHLVQGHVTGTAELVAIEILGQNKVYTFKTKSEYFRYMISEGSIAIDGVSLTIAKIESGTFCVSLIPHTLSATTLGLKKIGDKVNIEVDMMAKYVENFMAPYISSSKRDTDKWMKLIQE